MVTTLILDLDGDDAPPFENEVTSFQVLIGGAAELNVHLLIETKITESWFNTSEGQTINVDILTWLSLYWPLMCHQCHFHKCLHPYLAVALHGRRCVDRVPVQTVTWHLVSHHTGHDHARVDPCTQSSRLVHSVKHEHEHTHKFTHFLPTNANLYVVAVGGILQVVDGAHHVEGHVTNVMSVVLGFLRSPSNHHVGISNGLDLERNTAAALTQEHYTRVNWITQRTNICTRKPWRRGASRWACRTACTWCWAWRPPAAGWCGCRCG